MASIMELGRTAWRKNILDGVASSGFHKPEHAQIFAFVDAVHQQVAAVAALGEFQGGWSAASGSFPGGGTADKGDNWLVATAGTTGGVFFAKGDRLVALVENPSTTTFSASWGVIPANARTAVFGVDAGAGTANAIEVTTEDAVGNGTVVIFSLFEATTSSPVTLSINGGTALTIKTNRGTNASALSAGMDVWGRVRTSDNTFRLLNDQDVSALVAQAEAARDEAAGSAGEAAAVLDAVSGIADAVIDPQFTRVADASDFHPTIAPNYIRTSSHTSMTYGGGALYRKAASEPSHAGKFSITLADGVTVVWYELCEPIVTPQMFGAIADNGNVAGAGTDCRQAFLDFWSYCAKPATRCAGFVPAGYYRIASQMVWDLGLASPGTSPALLPQIDGAGEASATFVFDNGVASPAFHVTDLTGYTAGDGQRPTFYGGMKHFGVRANVPSGTAFKLGDGGTTYFNGFHVGPLIISNPAATEDSIACHATGLISSELNITANAGGVPASHGGHAADFYGTALRVEHCNMTGFRGAYGNAKYLFDLPGTGSCYGNIWYNVDFEVCHVIWRQTNPNAGGNGANKILGGTMTLCDHMFDVTAGQCVDFDGAPIGDVRLSIFKNFDSDVSGVYGGHGVIIRRQNRSIIGQVRAGNYWDSNVSYPPSAGSAVPVQPTLTRGAWIRNRWGQDALIYIFSNSDSSLEVYKRDWFDYTSSEGRRVVAGAVGTVTVQLKAGEWIRIPSSSAAASWLWEGMQ